MDKNFPSPEELQREFEGLLRQRFGANVQVFAQQLNPTPEPEDAPMLAEPSTDSGFRFSLKPKDVKAHLDRFVIAQDEAKKALAIAVCDHYNHVSMALDGRADALEYTKQNVLILGPTGVGKTYLLRKIADLIGVPFVKADATRFSETGYVGANADDLIRDLVSQAGGDVQKAQYGIVYLDEADKLAGPGGQAGRDVNGRGVQFGLLKLMEETDVDLAGSHDMPSQIKALMDFQKKGRVEKQVVNTRHILFIVSGAFTGLSDLVKKRMKTGGIGFHGRAAAVDGDETALLQCAETPDFIQYGFEPEFIGRLPVRVVCHHLSSDHLFHIMKHSEGSIIRQYQAAFQAYNIRAQFADSALTAIADLARKEMTGARALMTVCERTFRDFKYELPSSNVSKLLVTGAVVSDPAKALLELLASSANSAVNPARGQDFSRVETGSVLDVSP